MAERIALRIEYDGTDFHGSQLQANARTVQGDLEKALLTLFQIPIRIKMASRTDAGVHATDQIAAFNADTQFDMTTIRKALNYHLPKDVAVKTAQKVHGAFDARGGALSRKYVYKIDNSITRSPITRRTEISVQDPLDETQMSAAAQVLVGTHDFMSFAGPSIGEGGTAVRRLSAIDVTRDGDLVTVFFEANAYVHQQVRKMVAALIKVGRRTMTQGDIESLIETPERGSFNPVAPAHALCLTQIVYPETGSNALHP